MRTQLRPFWSPADLKRIYHRPYDHTRWPDHIQRVNWTIDRCIEFARHNQVADIMDLSCGDAAIVRGIASRVVTVQRMTLGDIVEGDTPLDVIGPIEKTLGLMTPSDPTKRVDLFVCSETLEHLEDPDVVLRGIRAAAYSAVITTPIGETAAVGNEEHYWGWDEVGVFEMLRDAGFSQYKMHKLETSWYDYQLWLVS